MAISKFSAGIITGATLGLLFAPVKGAKTRKAISNVAGTIKNGLDKLFGNSTDELDKLKAALEDKTEMLSAEDRQKLVQLIDENKRLIKEESEKDKTTR